MPGISSIQAFEDFEGSAVTRIQQDDAISTALSPMLPERFSHPDVQRFLEPALTFDVATSAYNQAVSALGTCFTPAELERIRTFSSIQDVHDVAIQAQHGCKKGKTENKVERFLQVLSHYSNVLDIISQAHAEYTCLVWGAMKWLLQASMNYFNLLQRLAAMLSEIGHNLPRFLFYKHILPTNRMAGILSELYAAIVEFLHPAVAFFRRRRLRKCVSALWSPFEIKFQNAVDKIQVIQRCLESDAHATAIAQQQIYNAALSVQVAQLALVTKHTLDSVRELKSNKTTILLSHLRRVLFRGHESDTSYHEEAINLTNATRAEEWTTWVKEETKHIPWTFHNRSSITQTLCNTLQPQMACLRLQKARRAATDTGPILIYIFWSPEMNSVSALASLIFQILVQRPEILHRRESDFYLRKFKSGIASFDLLWKTFLEMILAVNGTLCLLHIPSVGPHQIEFVHAFLELFSSWTGGAGPPINIVLYHPYDSSFGSRADSISLDAEYDITPALDSSDALHQVILAESGVQGILSDAMIKGVWETLWITIRYSAIALTRPGSKLTEDTIEELLHKLRTQHCGTSPQTSSIGSDTNSSNDFKKRLHQRVQDVAQKIPYEPPVTVRARLRRSTEEALQQPKRKSSTTSTISNKSGGTYSVPSVSWATPLRTDLRNKIWGEMKKTISEAIQNACEELLRANSKVTSETAWWRDGEVQTPGLKDGDQTNSRAGAADIATRQMTEGVIVAIEAGLVLIVEMLDDVSDSSCHTIS